jgi:hypothetical protein
VQYKPQTKAKKVAQNAPWAKDEPLSARDIATSRHALTMRILDKYQVTPLQVLMEAMLDARDRSIEARRKAERAALIGDEDKADELIMKSAMEMGAAAKYAADAAPYAHPKLGAIAMDIKQDTRAQLRIVSEFADSPTVIDNATGAMLDAFDATEAAANAMRDADGDEYDG